MLLELEKRRLIIAAMHTANDFGFGSEKRFAAAFWTRFKGTTFPCYGERIEDGDTKDLRAMEFLNEMLRDEKK